MHAPVPSNEPTAAIDSKSSPTSRCSAVSIGVEDPPGVHAFSDPPPSMPPAYSSSSTRNGVPSGSS